MVYPPKCCFLCFFSAGKYFFPFSFEGFQVLRRGWTAVNRVYILLVYSYWNCRYDDVHDRKLISTLALRWKRICRHFLQDFYHIIEKITCLIWLDNKQGYEIFWLILFRHPEFILVVHSYRLGYDLFQLLLET